MSKPQSYTMDLTPEFVDHIIKTELSIQYNGVIKDIERLSKQETLENYQEEDLLNCVKWRDAFYTVLEYYTTPDELKELLNQE